MAISHSDSGCLCSDLAAKMFAHIRILGRIGSSFYWHGFSPEEALHYPNSDRCQGGREADVAPSENHHIAFQLVLTADSLSTSSASTRKEVENSLTCFSMTEKSWKR